MAVRVHRGGGRPPGVRFQIGDRYISGDVVIWAGESAVFRVHESADLDKEITLDWTGPGRIRLDGTVAQITGPAPDRLFAMTVTLNRVTSLESGAAAFHFVRQVLGLNADHKPTASGSTWWVPVGNGTATITSERSTGTGSNGLPSSQNNQQSGTTLENLRAFFDPASGRQISGTTINAPCKYRVSGGEYVGRISQISDRWLNINTKSIVPGLGVHVTCNFELTHRDKICVFEVTGVMSRKKDAPGGGAYTTTLGLRISSIDEGDSPGLLLPALEELESRPRSERS
jgi:hypothetical protein